MKKLFAKGISVNKDGYNIYYGYAKQVEEIVQYENKEYRVIYYYDNWDELERYINIDKEYLKNESDVNFVNVSIEKKARLL